MEQPEPEMSDEERKEWYKLHKIEHENAVDIAAQALQKFEHPVEIVSAARSLILAAANLIAVVGKTHDMEGEIPYEAFTELFVKQCKVASSSHIPKELQDSIHEAIERLDEDEDPRDLIKSMVREYYYKRVVQ